jgi:PAS domain-containing protein
LLLLLEDCIRSLRPLTFTLICVLGIALLKYVIHISTGVDSPLILFYSAVILCAWYGGFTQGLLASALSMVLAYTVFTPYPAHTALDLGGRFFLFLVDSTIVALMAARLRELKIVAERNLEIEKRESKDYLDSVIDNLPNMLFIKEAKSLRFVRFNKAGEDLIGISRENMLGKNDFDIFPSEQAAFFTENDRYSRGAAYDSIGAALPPHKKNPDPERRR